MSSNSFHRARRRCGLSAWSLLLLGLICAGAGCTTSGPPPTRPFVFGQDTFAYPNELVWEYKLDPETGGMSHQRREPPATYSHRCFVMVRSTLQFHAHARFAPELPEVSHSEYLGKVRQVLSANPRRHRPEAELIVIPGQTNLHQLSLNHPAMLKEECGGALQSYFQRGHWRMVLPFTRAHQARMATQLQRANGAAGIHLARFPQLSINHAAIIYGCREEPGHLRFFMYDPNAPHAPVILSYDRQRRRFSLPQNTYFSGGRVDVYQVYHSWNY